MEETGGRTTQISPSSSSSTLANRNEIETQRSTDESCINSVFGSVATRAEADYSMIAFQSFMKHDGPKMLVENPGFQPVETAFQFMKTPMVQEMVGSVMCDIGVICAMMKNEAIQAFLRSLIGNSAIRLTNGATDTAVANKSQLQGSGNEDNLVSVILNWLLENIEGGILGFFGTLRSLVNNTIESPQNENIGSGSSSGQVIHLTLFLSIINLLIVFVRRALKHKLVI